MSKKMNIPNPSCNKCGKEAAVDREKSNENWTVFKVNEPCACGGKFEFDLSKI